MLTPLFSILVEAEALLRRSYPPFVYGSGLAEDVPVFVFHDISEGVFEARLAYLAENGYRTVTADELCAYQQGRCRLPDRAVLLTIDDGLESVWRYGYPLLRRYGMQATVFLIPGYLRRSAQRRPNLDDVWSGSCDREKLEPFDPGPYRLVYWEEAREMQASGHLDFQSHSLYHHQVFQDGRLEGFLDPYSDRDRFYDWRVPEGYEARVVADELEHLGGLPVYRSDSLFCALRRFRDDPDVREALVQETQRRGGSEFLRDAVDARRVLREKHRSLTGGRSAGTLATAEATRREAETDLRESRERIEAELGKPVRHLCFPYNRHSAEARELSRRAGYSSTFVGLEPKKRVNAPGGDPFRTVRLKHDYLPRLPGRERDGLAGIVLAKVRARARGSKID